MTPPVLVVPNDGDELSRYSTAAAWRRRAPGALLDDRRIFVIEMRVFVRLQVIEIGFRLWSEGIILRSRGSIRFFGRVVRCVVGVLVSPRIVAWGFRVVSDLGLGEGEQRCGVDMGRAGGFCDDGGAGFLEALAAQDVQARSNSFDRRLGEATEEFLGRHGAEVSVGANGVASDPGRKAAIAMAERAGENIGERLARGDAQAFDIVAEASAFGDRLNEFCAGCIPGTVCLDRDIPGVQGKDEQPDQGRVIDSVHFETLGQRLGAQRADDLVALMGDLPSRTATA